MTHYLTKKVDVEVELENAGKLLYKICTKLIRGNFCLRNAYVNENNRKTM